MRRFYCSLRMNPKKFFESFQGKGGFMFQEILNSQEVLKNPGKAYQFTVMRPGGNDTALVSGVITDANLRKEVNDLLLKLYPNVEQVGFVDLDAQEPELMMAGGEFCGNATRSTAWLALEGRPGTVDIKVSGVGNRLKAGVTASGEAFAQMPIYPLCSKITADPDAPGNLIVEMEGITQYINFNVGEITGLSDEQIKQKAIDLIRAKKLDRFPAAGVIYSQNDGEIWRIKPVVYVRDINTLYLETACGSGTTALGMALALQKGESINEVPVIQPSGLPIRVSVEFDGKKFSYTQISGPVEKLTEGTLVKDQASPYLVERLTDPKELARTLASGGLTALYKDIFSEAPYFESFTDEAVSNFFEEYRRDGVLLVARDPEGTIGFGAAVPLTTVPDIAEIIGAARSEDSRWYIADLGVKKQQRRKGIGKIITAATLGQIQSCGGCRADLRTSINNFIALSLYRKLGFQTIGGVTQEVRGERSVPDVPETDMRIFLSKAL